MKKVNHVLMTADTVSGVWNYAMELSRILSKFDIKVSVATLGSRVSPSQRAEAKAIPNLDLYESSFKLEWICYEDEVRDGLRHASTVVAPTEAMLSEINRIYGEIPGSRVIYNARSEEQFKPSAKEPFILTVGRLWDEAKNISALEAIAGEVDWPIYAAGEPHREVNECTHENVIGLEKLSTEEMAGWMGRASIYALPARYEPFGLSALEAALSGCALVLGDIPSLREVWADNALYVDPKNHESLRNTLNSLIANPVEIEQLGNKARQRAKLFDPHRMGCDYLELYETLVEGCQSLPLQSRITFH